MELVNQDEIDQEPELAPVVCPRCANEIKEEPFPEACPNCQKRLDLAAQFAYCRGLDAFSFGQELLIRIPPKKRRKSLHTKEELEGLLYYRQAYSSLQLAFQGELAESQRQLGIKMFAAMAALFQMHAMISPLETAYWSLLQKELTKQLAYAAVKEKLEIKNTGGVVGLVRRWRLRYRRMQIEKALIELDTKIRVMEKNINFAEHLRISRGSRLAVSKS